jgi:hypothetical protein
VIGFENIAAHNGWAMAAVGWGIVFTGLTVLSFTIAQLHKVLDIWDNRNEIIPKFKNRLQKQTPVDEPVLHFSRDIQDAMRNFKLLTNRLGEPFSLPKLIDLSKKCGLTNPYSTINTLLTSKIIIPDGKGYFIWYY